MTIRKIVFSLLIILSSSLSFAASNTSNVSDVKFKYKGDTLYGKFTVTNISNARIKGGICWRTYDKDGFQITHHPNSDISIAPNASKTVTDDTYKFKTVDDLNEIDHIKVFFNRYTCVSDAHIRSNIVKYPNSAITKE